jgi:hypothetical protein
MTIAIDRLHRRLTGGVETERHIGAPDVVVDGLGNADYGDA